MLSLHDRGGVFPLLSPTVTLVSGGAFLAFLEGSMRVALARPRGEVTSRGMGGLEHRPIDGRRAVLAQTHAVMLGGEMRLGESREPLRVMQRPSQGGRGCGPWAGRVRVLLLAIVTVRCLRGTGGSRISHLLRPGVGVEVPAEVLPCVCVCARTRFLRVKRGCR